MGMVTGWEKAAVVIAGAALFISIGSAAASVVVAERARSDARAAADDSKRIAQDANRVAQESYALAAQASEREIASRVFLGEAPPKYERNGYPIWSVSNASGVDVTKVWVEGKKAGDPAHIRIGHVQQCHLYTLSNRPDNFLPTWVHFFDGGQHWRRSLDGELGLDPKPKLPADGRTGAPEVHQMVGTCGG